MITLDKIMQNRYLIGEIIMVSDHNNIDRSDTFNQISDTNLWYTTKIC